MTTASPQPAPVPWVRAFAQRLRNGDFALTTYGAVDEIFAALQLPAGDVVKFSFADNASPLLSGWDRPCHGYPVPPDFQTAEAVDEWCNDIAINLFKLEIPNPFSILLLEAEAFTYWLWRAFSKQARPVVVVADFDPQWSPVESVSPSLAARVKGGAQSGPSLRALERFGQRHGYSLVGADHAAWQHRAFFVLHELLVHAEQSLPLFSLSLLPEKPRFRPGCGATIVESNYLQADNLAHLQGLGLNSSSIIFECGSRDAIDACNLAAFFNAPVHAFECNPEALAICRENARFDARVQLVDRAVWDADGLIDFFPVRGDETLTTAPSLSIPGGNIGASACFPAINDNLLYPEKYVQSRIEVPATRLDTYCKEHGIPRIDLLCMDLQGAELRALRGLGALLDTVQAIITETQTRALYQGVDTYQHLSAFLKTCGFRPVVEKFSAEWGFGDAMFVRDNPVSD